MFLLVELREVLPFIRIITAVLSMLINVFQVMALMPIWNGLLEDLFSFQSLLSILICCILSLHNLYLHFGERLLEESSITLLTLGMLFFPSLNGMFIRFKYIFGLLSIFLIGNNKIFTVW